MSDMPDILPLIRAALIEAWQSRLARSALIAFATLYALSRFIGALTLTDSTFIQTAFLGSGLRLAAVLLIAIHVVFSQLRELADKNFEWILALGLPRGAYVSGRYLGQLTVAGMVAGMATLTLVMQGAGPQASIWGLSLLLELAIISAMALFASLILGQAAGALGLTLGFYLLARSMGTLLLIARSPPLDGGEPYNRLTYAILQGIDLLLPDLEGFTRTTWLTESAPMPLELLGTLVQAILYVLLLIISATLDFRRKDL
jgi:hypothetical protein